MSNEVTSIAKRKAVGSSARKAVLMYMADNASDDGTGIWTSKANMAADLELSRRTVQREIQELESMGVIRFVAERPCRNGYTVEYSINLCALKSLKSTRDTLSPVTPSHPTRDTLSPQDVTPCHPNHPRTTIEPPYSAKAGAERADGQSELLPSEPETEHQKLTKAVWQRGPEFLAERGVSQSNARSVIGKWLKDNKPKVVFEALADAKKCGTQDPVSYITKALQGSGESYQAQVKDLVSQAMKKMNGGLQ